MSHLSRNQRVKPKAKLLTNALALGLVLIFIGCESEPPQKAAPAPAVVRKKIDTSDQTGSAKKAQVTRKDARSAGAPKQTASQDQASKPDVKTAAKAQPAQSGQTAATPKPAPGKTTSTEATNPAAKAPAAEAKPQPAAPAQETQAPAPAKAEVQIAAAATRPPVIIVDPFEPLFAEKTAEQKAVAKPKPDRPRRIPQTPLEKIDLGQLKLTAIFRTPAGNRALVEEASGKGYIIQQGTWIGVHAGRVQMVTDDAVVVEEEIENALGEISLTKRELKLQKPPGE